MRDLITLISEILGGHTRDPDFLPDDEPGSAEDSPEDGGAEDDVDPGLVAVKDALTNPTGFGFKPLPGPNSTTRWTLTPIARPCGPPATDPDCVSPRPHLGIDINRQATPLGAPVVAVAAGTVVHAGPSGACGNTVKIDHGASGFSRYCHMQAGSIAVNVGDPVEAGDDIGNVGETGRTFGPHLHFETYDSGGANVDPVIWLGTHAVYYPIKRDV